MTSSHIGFWPDDHLIVPTLASLKLARIRKWRGGTHILFFGGKRQQTDGIWEKYIEQIHRFISILRPGNGSEIRKDANDRKILSEISADRTFISVGFVLMVAPASPSNTLGHNILSVNMRNEYGIIYLINLLKLKIIQVIKIVASARDQSITPLLSVSRAEASHRTYDQMWNLSPALL